MTTPYNSGILLTTTNNQNQSQRPVTCAAPIHSPQTIQAQFHQSPQITQHSEYSTAASSPYHSPVPPSPCHFPTPSTHGENNYGGYEYQQSQNHYAPPPIQPQSYHRPTGHQQYQAHHPAEPTMIQLLAEQPTGMSSYPSRIINERDATMASATAGLGAMSWRKGQGFKEWEKVKLDSAEVKRKADLAQLCACLMSHPPPLSLASWVLTAS